MAAQIADCLEHVTLWRPVVWRSAIPGQMSSETLTRLSSEFALDRVEAVQPIRAGTSSNIYRAKTRAGDFVLREITAFNDGSTSERCSRLYELLSAWDVPTKRIKRTASGTILYRDPTTDRDWECTEYFQGRRATASDAIALGSATATLHACLDRLGTQGAFVGHARYWLSLGEDAVISQLDWLLVNATLPSEVSDGLRAAITAAATWSNTAEMEHSHGDLHLDNIHVSERDGTVLIYDFDVVGTAPGALAPELGNLWHRLVREALIRGEHDEPASAAAHILSQFNRGYQRVAQIKLDAAALLDAAHSESTRKLGASIERFRRGDDTMPWLRIATNHVRFILEYQALRKQLIAQGVL